MCNLLINSYKNVLGLTSRQYNIRVSIGQSNKRDMLEPNSNSRYGMQHVNEYGIVVLISCIKHLYAEETEEPLETSRAPTLARVVVAMRGRGEARDTFSYTSNHRPGIALVK